MKNEYLNVVNRWFAGRIPFKDILYIEKDGRKVIIVTHDNVLDYYKKMDDIQQNLDSRFYRCRKGFILNLDRVKLMLDQKVTFDNDQTCELGYDAYRKAKQRYKAYLRRII